MLGQDVLRAAGDRGVGLTRADLDVTDSAAVAEAVGGATVINCAGYTDVDGAEADPETAHAVNERGARTVAEAAARVVYVSTDYVFDGSKTGAYLESDAVNPLSAYGRSKLAGERATLTASPHSVIVRTSWLFGAGGRNFVDTMLALGRERDEVEVVTDQVGSPTWSAHLAEGLVELAERRGDIGIFHAAGTGACSWYELAVEVFDRGGVRCRVLPTTSERYSRPAPRPAYSVLASERDEVPVLPPWQEGVAAYLAEKTVIAG
jgi:dTDP-4-dehydrorhamnose reductase